MKLAMENDLGRDSIPKLVWQIAFPSMMAQFVSVLYNIVDRIFVGNIPEYGDMALAGIGVCGPVVMTLAAFSFLVGIGGAPLMGISMGEGRTDKAEQIVANCFLMLCVLGVVLTGEVLIFHKELLLLFGASEAILPYASPYFTVYVSGTVFALVGTGMNQFIISQGFAKVGMISVVLGAVLNIVLDPVFIFLLDMGVRGAAIATVLSQIAGAVYVLHFLLGPRPRVCITFSGYDWRIVRRVLVMGFPPFIIASVDNVVVIAINALLQRYGGPGHGDMLVTCNAIVQSFLLVLTMPLGGISGGTQGILSYNFGAGETKRVLQAQKYITGFCLAYTAILFVLARVAGPGFCALFTDDPDITDMACRAIRISTLGALPMGVQYEIVDGFTGLGQPQLALPLSCWRKLVNFVCVFSLPALFGIRAIYYAQPLCDVIGCTVSVIVYGCTIRRILCSREQLIHK